MASRQQASQFTQPMGKAAQGRQVTEPIIASEEYMRYLTKLILSTTELRKAGFIVNPLNQAELQAKVKCQKCNKKCNKNDRAPKLFSSTGESSSNDNHTNGAASTASNTKSSNSSHIRKFSLRSYSQRQQNGLTETSTSNGKQQQVQITCRFHPGRMNNKIWTCCNTHISQPPCSGSPSHIPTIHAPGALEARWLFVPTPSHPPQSQLPPPSTRFANFNPNFNPNQTPPFPRTPPSYRRAVAIDCEMGTTTDLESELIRLSLVDYFTGQILIDSLVRPLVAMQHMNTKYSGVTRQDINNAVRNGTCIMGGLEEARSEVWKYVGPETVVVGHSASNDLTALRWIHGGVVDSFVVEEGVRRELKAKEEEEERVRRERETAEALVNGVEVEEVIKQKEEEEAQEKKEEEAQEKKKKRVRRPEDGMSLKALAKKKLGRVIQDRSKKGHDSVEDAVAARDLIHHHILGMMKKDREGKEVVKEAEEEAKKEGGIIAEIGIPFVAS